MGHLRKTVTTTREQRTAWRAAFEQRIHRGDGCWLWLGAKGIGGYGRFSPALHVGIYAHRFAWELEHDQSVPDGLDVMHSCDNPPCVNPAHLSIGTRHDNMQDCVAKGRHVSRPPRGEAHRDHVLTESDVREIRAQRVAGSTARELSQRYGVSDTRIYKIVARKAWRHVP